MAPPPRMHARTTRRWHVVVTGVGFRADDISSVGETLFSDPAIKPNIGAAVARQLLASGHDVTLVSRTHEKLERVAAALSNEFPERDVAWSSVDLIDPVAVDELASRCDSFQDIHLVHCAGLGAGSYNLPDDNPYLPISETPPDLPELEFQAVVTTLLHLTQSLLPLWRRRGGARVVVVTSMSGIRAVPLGFSHSAAKAGAHMAVRALALELQKAGVRVSEVLPGIVDTGLYDPPAVKEAVRVMGKAFGYDYAPGYLPTMRPEAVAEMVVACLESTAHILEVAMVAEGQFPHASS